MVGMFNTKRRLVAIVELFTVDSLEDIVGVVHRAWPSTRTAISVFDTPSAGSNMIRAPARDPVRTNDNPS
jgi:hypothetical protein